MKVLLFYLIALGTWRAGTPITTDLGVMMFLRALVTNGLGRRREVRP
jgi:hypothetical protein